MARAHAIWIVMDDGKPVAAFTVKHELRTWLSRQNPGYLDALALFRCLDNPMSWTVGQLDRLPEPVTEVSLEDL